MIRLQIPRPNHETNPPPPVVVWLYVAMQWVKNGSVFWSTVDNWDNLERTWERRKPKTKICTRLKRDFKRQICSLSFFGSLRFILSSLFTLTSLARWKEKVRPYYYNRIKAMLKQVVALCWTRLSWHAWYEFTQLPVVFTNWSFSLGKSIRGLQETNRWLLLQNLELQYEGSLSA